MTNDKPKGQQTLHKWQCKILNYFRMFQDFQVLLSEVTHRSCMVVSIVRVYRNYSWLYSASWEKLAFACPERLDPATSVGQRKMTGNCWKLCVCLLSTLRVFVRELCYVPRSYKVTLSSETQCIYSRGFSCYPLITGETWLIKQGLPTSASLPSVLMTPKLGSRSWTSND